LALSDAEFLTASPTVTSKKKRVNFSKRASLYLGFVVFVATLMAVLAPKTTHPLVAALVQVANTPSSAVPVVHAPAAGNVYFATCEGFFSFDSGSSSTMPPAPADTTLVIEAASIRTQTGVGSDPSNAFVYASNHGSFSRSACKCRARRA
jgi:hypothetical protein